MRHDPETRVPPRQRDSRHLLCCSQLKGRKDACRAYHAKLEILSPEIQRREEEEKTVSVNFIVFYSPALN